MKLIPIKDNMIELRAYDYEILVSYKTPVAVRVLDGNAGVLYYKTEKKWNNTTTKHINQWLAGNIAKIKPQVYFDNLLAEVTS